MTIIMMQTSFITLISKNEINSTNMERVDVSILTPTYNRGYLLLRLYKSILKQSYRNFEWLIVDDGSTDDTRKVVEQKILNDVERNGVTIRYIYKDNGGKHTAVNRGVHFANGELVFIADSDDVLPDNAIETVVNEWMGIKDKSVFAGICGLDASFDGKVIGSGLPAETIDSTSIDVRFNKKVTGDMKEVFLKSVLQEFPFPEIEGERFCPEVLVWNRIATKYKLRYINKVIYLVEYQPSGITSAITQVRMKSPIAATITYAEMLHYDISWAAKIKSAINYYRFKACIIKSSKKMVSIPHVSIIWSVCKPLGWLMYRKDLKLLGCKCD